MEAGLYEDSLKDRSALEENLLNPTPYHYHFLYANEVMKIVTNIK